ncbi:Ankyrin-2 [Anabarilius grahami]|uniref:Ankyrin-2 n=1 Tax=Anabarilius grahami TaxID=495550 RepID=A0A3N0YQ30_ANAGA|nr:Ankyrin-2 [Anabarilius grahami]
MEDDEDTETTETSFLKTHLIRDSPALASPDLLSEVSEMKQDLIKMTAILTTDSSEKAGPMQGDYLDKGVEEVSAEPFEIMEKVKEDLEKVSEILRSGTFDKEESAKTKSRPYRKDEGWVLLTESEIEEAKMMAAFESQESLLKEVRVNRGSQRPKGARDRSGMDTVSTVKEYLLDAPESSMPASQETPSQQRFTEVVLRRGGRKIVATVTKDTKAHTTEVKKPVRRKGPQGHTEETQSFSTKESNVSKSTEKSSEGDAFLPVPGDQKKSPVSPVVEETPIGSIKEKVKALQKKVEEEQKGHKKQTGKKPPYKATEGKASSVVKDQKTSGLKKQTSTPQKQSPSRSPKPEPGSLEETMSVRELMRAFQTGQDPSKRKSGLFEHKASSKIEHKTVSKPEDILTKSQSLPQAQSHEEVSPNVLKPEGHHEEKDVKISPHVKHSKDFEEDTKASQKSGESVVFGTESAGPSTHSSMTKTVPQNLSKHGRDLLPDNGTENIAFDDSSDSVKHEALIDSPSANLAEVEAPLSSEESCKHEGMAETPETSPESLSLSPKSPAQSILAMSSKSVAVTPKVKTSKISVSFSTEMKTTTEQASEATIHHPALSKAVDEPTKSESMSIPHRNRGVNFGGEKTSVDKDIVSVSSKPSKSRKLTKRASETLESFLSDDESFDGEATPTSADFLASRAATQDHGGLVLPLRHQDSDTLSPVADDSFTISHKDSLEGSPLMEDNSSHKTPDSIEPSPTNESPCRDSLESSPVEMKTNLAFPPTVEQPSVTTGPLTSSKAPEIPPESLRSRMLKEQEGNADDDSCEQTSLMTSSGKSPLSPDTPSSEEVSYEVNPKTPDPMVLIVPFKPSVIPEETVEDDELKCGLTQRKITPEEEMFKMAAKIKTFDEMEQDEKDKKDNRKDSESSQTSDSIRLFALTSKYETSSVDDVGFTEPNQASEIARSVEPIIKVQPPSPFPAGIRKSPQTAEDIQQTMAQSAASSAESAMRRPQSVSEKHNIKPHLQESHSEKFKDKEYVDSELAQLNKTAPKSNNLAANITDEQKEQSLKRSKGNQEIYSHEKQNEAASYQNVDYTLPSQEESNVTDEIKGDYMRHTGASYVDICSGSLDIDSIPIVIGQTRETFKPEICIYDDTEEDDAEEEPPKTESRGVTAKAETDAWNSMREDDDAFAARVKEEEQKILGLVVERHSQGATPDTTPARTPTEEGTPTSEQNPFLFQEGKLFEMTRSGAIDMTKRSYEEEGFAFYQIEQPIEEGIAEEGGSGPGRAGNEDENEVGCNLSLQIKAEEDNNLSKEAADLSVHSPTEVNLAAATKSDVLKSKTPIALGVSVSTKTSEEDQRLPETAEIKSDKVISEGQLISDPGYTDTVIANVQTAVSTTTRLVHSQQDQEFSDSSPEDQHSVIEQTKIIEKTESKSKLVSKSYTATSQTSTTRKDMSTSKEEEKPKSRIPVKASSLRSESVELSKDKMSKLPIKPQSRRKSDTDTGPPITSSLTKSSKAKSFCESDSTKKPTKKDQRRPTSTDLSSTTKTLPSRLPVRGKPGQPIQTSTPAKQKKARPTDTNKQSVPFCEEISHEAAKVVESLAQAEKDKQGAAALSDDESITIDASVIESEHFLDMQMPFPEDSLVIRPRWDNPVETQMERIPADKVRSQVDPQDETDRKEARLAVIADHLGFSWSELAQELEFSELQIKQIRNENPNSLQDQSHALIRLWKEREGKNAPENTLMKTLTKINRMDIVHLIETKIIQSSQNQSSHTYAEIEQTISLDHSEGFSALQEDMDSPRPGRRAEVTQRGSELGPLVASVEDLSCNVSSLNDSQKERLLTDKEMGSEVVRAPTHSSFDMAGLRQQFPGTIKQVSPFFTLYKTAPWRLQSHVCDTVYKGGTIPDKSSNDIHETVDDPLQELGATGGQFIPVSTQQDDELKAPPINSMEGYKLSQRQSTLSDFGHTLLESENVEPDFRSVKTPSTSVQVSLTDLSSISPIISTSSSDQGNSPESHESLGKMIPYTAEVVQLSPDFKYVVSKFEQTLPSFGGDEPESSLALPGTDPFVAAMTPYTLGVTQELKASEMPTKLTGDQMQLDATAVLDVDFPIYSVNLKSRPRPVHTDSTESDAEFFDCQQTFSETSEPEVGSSELLDVPQAIYQVEELSSLSSSPEYLTDIPKLREYTQLRKDDRPLSWGSEDLPIVLEPEDEYTGEAGEEKAFPYDYTGDHSFAEELPPMERFQYDDDDDFLGREIAEELGSLSGSSEEEVLTTRVVRRRVIIQGDEMPEIPPQTVTEEQYTDEFGNMVVKKITRKIIRKYVSADGVEREEVMLEGPQQEAVTVDEADGFSKVVKRTVVKSGGDQTEVTFSEPSSYIGATASEFEEEPVQGRKVSKVVKTMVVQGERMEKLIGDPSLSSDLPSAKDDFEKALSYVGSFGKVHLPHLVERETVKEDGSVVRRTRMHKTRTQKRTVVKDGQTKQTHLERLEDAPDSLRPDDLQRHLHQLLQRYCTPEPTEDPDAPAQDKQ